MYGAKVTNQAQLKKLVFLGLLLAVSWCVMTFVHEAGHVLCGCLGSGRLGEADLLPWHLPHSTFEPNPRPLLTLWGGPMLGVLVPLVIAGLFRRDWLWLIAYFCLLANGVYLATAWGSGERYLDTPQLLQDGAHPATIVAYCLVTIVTGYIGLRRQLIRLWSGSAVN